MASDSAAALAFARDFATFRQHLEHAAVGAYLADEGDPFADAFLALLDDLEAGADPLDAISSAVTAWRNATDRLQAAAEAATARATAERERHQAEQDLARTATCSACGAGPGEPCQSLGTTPGPRNEAHRARLRAARNAAALTRT